MKPVVSTSAPQVLAAIHAVSAALGSVGISKARKSEGYGSSFKFRGIDEVMNALSPLLAEHGLIIMPRILDRSETTRQTGKGGTLYCVVVAAEFVFLSMKDGTSVTARTYGEAMDVSDKATNKAMAIAYKYAAFQTFCIPTEGSGDTDADATIHEPTTPGVRQQSVSQRAAVTVRPPAVDDEIPHTQPNHAQQASTQGAAVATAARQDGAATAEVAKMAAKAAAPSANWKDRERAKTRSRIDPQVSASVLAGVLSDLADVSTIDELNDWSGRRQRENTRAKLIDGHASSMEEAFKRKRLLIVPPVKAGVTPVSHDPETGELVGDAS